MRWCVGSLVLAACAAGTDGGGSVGEATASGTITDATCATTDNALRFSCRLTLDAAQEVSWSILEGDEVVRTWVTEADAAPVGDLWGLAPDTTYRWEATTSGGTASGEVGTGSLPDDLDGLSVTTSGTAPEVDALLTNLTCGGFAGLVMLDPAGRVVWYQDAESTGGVGSLSGVTGFDRDDDGDLLAAVDGERLVEWTPMGEVITEVGGFAHPLHHDVALEDGRIWALYAEQIDGYVVDGFVVVDDGVTTAEWSLGDHVTVDGASHGDDQFWGQVFPSATDFAHANAIEVRDGVALLSFRWLDAVMEVPADPADPDFGEPVFTLVGSSGSSVEGDVVFVDGGGFDGQHHASWSDDGHVAVFDNGTSTSRGLHVAVDLEAGTATEAASYPVGARCSVQGSVYDLADGQVLVTCADGGRVSAWPESGGEASWELTASCGGSEGGAGSSTTRVMPVDW